jgi:acylphosphatase/predicted small secreted protein
MTHSNITAGSVVEMVKKRLIVTGNVQGAGFRALVKKIARSMGIKGRVQNLDDGTVEIYCEAEESIFERFIKTIDIKHRNGNLLAIDVQAIKQHPEGTAEYHGENAPAPFMAFDIEYGQLGQSLTFAERESLERQELLIVGGTQVLDGLGVVGDKVDKGFKDLGQKINGMGQDVKSVGQKVEGVGQDVQAMHKDMNVKFEGLDKKYHLISEHLLETSQNIAGMNENIAHMNENNAKMNDNIKALIEGNARTNENMAKMNEDLSVIARALLELVESNIKKNGRRAKKAKG